MGLQNSPHSNFWTLIPVNGHTLHGASGVQLTEHTVESKLISNNNQVSSIFKRLGARVQIKHHFMWSNNSSQWKLKKDLLPPPVGSCWSAWKEMMRTIMIKNKDLRYTTLIAKCMRSAQKTHLTDRPLPKKPPLQLQLKTEPLISPQDGGAGSAASPGKPRKNSMNDVGNKTILPHTEPQKRQGGTH